MGNVFKCDRCGGVGGIYAGYSVFDYRYQNSYIMGAAKYIKLAVSAGAGTETSYKRFELCDICTTQLKVLAKKFLEESQLFVDDKVK